MADPPCYRIEAVYRKRVRRLRGIGVHRSRLVEAECWYHYAIVRIGASASFRLHIDEQSWKTLWQGGIPNRGDFGINPSQEVIDGCGED